MILIPDDHKPDGQFPKDQTTGCSYDQPNLGPLDHLIPSLATMFPDPETAHHSEVHLVEMALSLYQEAHLSRLHLPIILVNSLSQWAVSRDLNSFLHLRLAGYLLKSIMLGYLIEAKRRIDNIPTILVPDPTTKEGLSPTDKPIVKEVAQALMKRDYDDNVLHLFTIFFKTINSAATHLPRVTEGSFWHEHHAGIKNFQEMIKNLPTHDLVYNPSPNPGLTPDEVKHQEEQETLTEVFASILMCFLNEEDLPPGTLPPLPEDQDPDGPF